MNDIEMLRRIKERRGYTLDEMARAMGVSLLTVFRWLHKKNEPSPMALEKINSYIHTECACVSRAAEEREHILAVDIHKKITKGE